MHIHSAAWLFIVFLCSACGQFYQKQVIPPANRIQKISITRGQVFDLSGYAGSGGSSPFNLFDENAYVDPRYEKPGDTYIPVTNCQPIYHSSIYFRGAEGSRIVLDLKIPYCLREIYLYDRSRVGDSCRIYTGNLKNWKLAASLLTTSEIGNWGWKKINLDEKTRFVMIRFSSYETAITEMVLYGIPQQTIPAAEDFSIHKGLTATTLNQFLGVNYVRENEPRWLKPFHYSRLYKLAVDYDNDTNREESRARFNMLNNGYYDKEKAKYIFDIDTIQHINQGCIWYSMIGGSKWMSQQDITDNNRPLNRPLLNTEDPASYSRHANMMWNLAAFFGYHLVDTNLLSLAHSPRLSGRGSMSIYENGNEGDANWVGNKYCSPYEYFAQSSADWDGDEGRLGKRFGIRQADPNALLMMSGLTELDTNRVKVYRFLAENLRDDRQFIWQGGIQYHHYAQSGGRGISPEADSMRWKLSKVADCSYRIAPRVKCFLGENGYDKSPVSWARTPLIPGLSASQSQGIMLLRSINATFFSGFDAYILYWLRDDNPENDPRVYLTSGILCTLPDGKTKVYPGWYYISTMVNRLGKFRPDKVIRETGDVWVYRYRHAEKPDSVAYFVYKPTVNGSQLSSYTLELGKNTGNLVTAIRFQDDSEQGTEEPIQVADGKIRLSVEEKPAIILYKEPPDQK
jgi:hypothetical protein